MQPDQLALQVSSRVSCAGFGWLQRRAAFNVGRGAVVFGAFLMALALGAKEKEAHAEPQISSGITGGYGVRALADSPRGAATLGLRADALFLRTTNREFAIGPYVEGLTVAFDDLQFGAGVSVLVPGLDEPAVVVSAGPLLRRAGRDGSWSAGASGQLFVGFREYNFHSMYAMANGLFVAGRMGTTPSSHAEIVGGVQLDLEFVALPFIFFWNAFR